MESEDFTLARTYVRVRVYKFRKYEINFCANQRIFQIYSFCFYFFMFHFLSALNQSLAGIYSSVKRQAVNSRISSPSRISEIFFLFFVFFNTIDRRAKRRRGNTRDVSRFSLREINLSPTSLPLRERAQLIFRVALQIGL